MIRTSVRLSIPLRFFPTLLLAALAAAVAGVSPRAAAGTIRHDRDPLQYLNYGAQHAAVGRFDIAKSEPGFVASGTLIGDRWVLTAAHTFDNATSGQFTVGDQTYNVADWHTHPKWNGNLRRGFDLTLVKLAEPVANVAPVPMYTGKREFGATASFAGFGRTGTGVTGDQTYDGLKRAGQNVVDGTMGKAGLSFRNKLPKDARLFVVDFDNPANAADNVIGAPEPTDLEYLISVGDSGGGAFADLGEGQVLIGVHSFAEIPDGKDDSDYGDVTGHVRVSSFAKWVNKMIRRDAQTASARLGRQSAQSGEFGRLLAPDDSATFAAGTAVPEPGALGLLCAVGALLLRRQRR